MDQSSPALSRMVGLQKKKTVSFVVSIKTQRKVSEATPLPGNMVMANSCGVRAACTRLQTCRKDEKRNCLSDLEFEFIVRKPDQGNFINNDMHGEGKGRIPCLPVLEQKDEPIHWRTYICRPICVGRWPAIQRRLDREPNVPNSSHDRKRLQVNRVVVRSCGPATSGMGLAP